MLPQRTSTPGEWRGLVAAAEPHANAKGLHAVVRMQLLMLCANVAGHPVDGTLRRSGQWNDASRMPKTFPFSPNHSNPDKSLCGRFQFSAQTLHPSTPAPAAMPERCPGASTSPAACARRARSGSRSVAQHRGSGSPAAAARRTACTTAGLGAVALAAGSAADADMKPASATNRSPSARAAPLERAWQQARDACHPLVLLPLKPNG